MDHLVWRCGSKYFYRILHAAATRHFTFQNAKDWTNVNLSPTDDSCLCILSWIHVEMGPLSLPTFYQFPPIPDFLRCESNLVGGASVKPCGHRRNMQTASEVGIEPGLLRQWGNRTSNCATHLVLCNCNTCHFTIFLRHVHTNVQDCNASDEAANYNSNKASLTCCSCWGPF